MILDKTMRVQVPCRSCGKMILTGFATFPQRVCDACDGSTDQRFYMTLYQSARAGFEERGSGMVWPSDYYDEVRAIAKAARAIPSSSTG